MTVQPKFKNETQDFRHRGYQDVDKVVMIYGDGPEPKDAQGMPLKKLWDHAVHQVITVADYVAPVEAPASGAV